MEFKGSRTKLIGVISVTSVGDTVLIFLIFSSLIMIIRHGVWAIGTYFVCVGTVCMSYGSTKLLDIVKYQIIVLPINSHLVRLYIHYHSVLMKHNKTLDLLSDFKLSTLNEFKFQFIELLRITFLFISCI